MKKVIQEYGSLMLAVIGCIVGITWLLNGMYMGTDGEKTKGIMKALGREAAFREEETTQIRDNLVENKVREEILLRCKTAIIAQKKMQIDEIFLAEWEGKRCPVEILHIYNGEGEDIVRSKGVLLPDRNLCFLEAGRYQIYVRVKEQGKVSKVFDVYVI